ncbi:hypothetical protein HK100_011091 [Physocladia obscura]|uniref:Amino acid permease/ SLC12A domain-containing protein n=1 Tax=Physocladia obscura TaxID=109957 RepID=A0AAD5XH83_9FUNG|nr:hypothetical protein HK100_011091 [Physocladia obscura]
MNARQNFAIDIESVSSNIRNSGKLKDENSKNLDEVEGTDKFSPTPIKIHHLQPEAIARLGMKSGSRFKLNGSQSIRSAVTHSRVFSIIEHAVGEDTCKYEEVTDEYLVKRGLQHDSINNWMMYAYFLGLILCLGCSNAWNSATVWGYGAVIVSAVIAGLAYTALVTIVAEMMTMLPFSGGMATFARSAFGPYVGYLVGTCEAWEYTLFGAQAVWQSGIVLSTAFNVDQNFAPLFWFFTVGLVLGCHVAGTKYVMLFICMTLFINMSAMVILIIPSLKTIDPWNNALYQAEFLTNLTNPVTGQQPTDLYTLMFPFGTIGIFQTIPTLMWTFLGIEAAPLCCEESIGFIENSPRIALKAQATMWFLVLGDINFELALDPLIDVFVTTYNITAGDSAYNALYCCLFLPNLLLAIACYSFACSRQVYGLSHVGYYNKKLSVVWQQTKVPIGSISMTLIFFMIVAVEHFKFI